MIIYIHGFGSSGHGGKASLFREYFEDEVIAPSLSYVPNLAIDTLEQLIEMLLEKGETVGLVGSSLGGYYSIYLANKYDLKAVLINPAIFPYKTLDKIGMARNYYDLTTFEVTNDHIQALKGLEVSEISNQENFITLLQTEDEVLDYNDAVEKLSESELVIEEGGTHSFENIESYFRKIGSFLA
ncbi:YqiA/YcfP family alpha/beta fold hydrolase [Poseidonibacter lekithochrous]|uniref:YqiA/YcfP family alpha/beta fold hydrolase n=1 Tax=Poseidonibacter lekithochrous TaxID=1904463 RepID=UPI000D3BAA4F|nr:YqiA/YcfP family alpha/beta fold hydrolase [Poseidonibacter lekithochrous]